MAHRKLRDCSDDQLRHAVTDLNDRHSDLPAYYRDLFGDAIGYIIELRGRCRRGDVTPHP